jgi:hypothetical protein
VLSFLLFEPNYIRLLMEIGERDGAARIGEIETLLGVPRATTGGPEAPRG